MKNEIVLIGVIVLLFMGLSGCEQSSNGNNQQSINQVTISEVILHPERYVNKIITINGLYAQELVNQSYMFMDYRDAVATGDGYIILDFSKIQKPGIQTYNMYSFTGKLVWHGKTGISTFEYWLEVTNVESLT